MMELVVLIILGMTKTYGASKMSQTTFVDVNDQTRQVNALTGGRNVAFFTIIEDIILDQNDYIFLQVANGTGTGNFTAEIDGYCIASER